MAALRGHLLMQLQAAAAAGGVAGAPPELQRAVAPLVWVDSEMQRGPPDASSDAPGVLVMLACSQVGAQAPPEGAGRVGCLCRGCPSKPGWASACLIPRPPSAPALCAPAGRHPA